ncbi:beta-hexosaminidase [Paraburkholderia agricolaris]|uniref:Beta-hexosaminidase n=1 Tax=Paraburkholderia agricolaris TaxID=2152888 RepID=A0ABW8ZLZ5_9BURK
MQKHRLQVPPEPTRRDTIGLRTYVKYDPMAPRATTPIMVGKHVVARRPLHGSVHTLYMILDGSTVVSTSISVPNEYDCDAAINKHRRKQQAASLADKTIAKAKRKPRALRIREVA